MQVPAHAPPLVLTFGHEHRPRLLGALRPPDASDGQTQRCRQPPDREHQNGRQTGAVDDEGDEERGRDGDDGSVSPPFTPWEVERTDAAGTFRYLLEATEDDEADAIASAMRQLAATAAECVVETARGFHLIRRTR